MKEKLHRIIFWSLMTLAATARADVIFSETFSYADGPITVNAADKWGTHSGTAGQADVAGGVLDLTEKESEDINAGLPGAPYAPGAGSVLYVAFKVNFSGLPSGAGGYFAHLKDTSTGFRARIFASTTGAAEGSLRLGIAATTSAANFVATDLALGTTHTVVLKHDVDSGTSVLWVDPTAESDPSAGTTDVATPLAVSAVAFRQSLSSGAGMGVLTVDDLIVATTFAEVLGTPPVDPPVISAQPQSKTVSPGADVTFTVGAGGTAPLSYQWRYGGADLPGETSATLTLTAVTVGQSGDYSVVVSNSAGTATSDPATLTVTTLVLAPNITQQPASLTVDAGADATFTVVAAGTGPLSYQWQFGGSDLPGATGSTLTIAKVTSADAGIYKVIVSNAADSVTSDPATLSVNAPPPDTIVTNIAFLHTPVDADYALTNTTQIYRVEGVVTTYANLTSGTANYLFYIQDDTGGIAVFWSGAQTTGKALPPPGARVSVTAPLSQFRGLMEFAPDDSNAQHSVTVLSTGNAQPAALPLPFTSQDPAVLESLEGRLVVAEGVLIDPAATAGVFASLSSGITMTDDSGQTFALYANAGTDLIGKAIPLGKSTVIGVLGQFDTSSPLTGGYQFIPTRFEDIVSTFKPPTVAFTNELSNLVRPGDAVVNSFTDQSLRSGEALTLRIEVSDPSGRPFTVTTQTAGLPATGTWSLSAGSAPAGGTVTGTFTYTAVAGDAGKSFPVTIEAANDSAASTTTIDVYVPTLAEQRVILTEFYANPTGTATAPNFNPLDRPVPQVDNVTLYDEFIELVNLSATDLDLVGWTVSDAVAKRHQFYASTPLVSSNAVVLFGGPLNTNAPVLPAGVYSEPASEGGGLALNNGGDTITIRNGSGNVVTRVVYLAADVGMDSSIVRFPTVDGPFVPHRTVNDSYASPGLQSDGKAWSEPGTAVVEHPPIVTTAALSGGEITLGWNTAAGFTYAVLRATAADGAYAPVATGLNAGTYSETPPAGVAFFYRISAQ